MSDGAPVEVSNQVVTIPNVLSLLRLLLIPLFIWLALGPEADGWAFCVLVISSITDWLDGVIARKFGMVTRLGQLLDPIADRLVVISTMIVLALRDLVPWWLVLLLVLRDVVMGAIQLGLNRKGVALLPVNYVGKAATLCLLFGMPTLLLTTGDGNLAALAQPIAWAFIIWGTGIYWWSAVLYAEQASAVARGGHRDITA